MAKRKGANELDALISLGKQMSNVLYNWSQRAGLEEREREVAKELYAQWDKKLSEYRAATQ